ncbi:hypothetical protein PIROE2DRAFT_36844, partial [Piromyces sp. E2]
RQPPNAFIIYNRRVRPSVRKENPDLSVAEISKIISKKWKSLPEEEKKVYYDESKRLPMQYMDPSISFKQPPNAYIIFNRKVRPSVRKENPDLSVAEISKIISKKWKNLPEEERKLYYEESRRLRNEFNM